MKRPASSGQVPEYIQQDLCLEAASGAHVLTGPIIPQPSASSPMSSGLQPHPSMPPPRSCSPRWSRLRGWGYMSSSKGMLTFPRKVP